MEQRHRLGRPLHHGDTIGIVAPSAPVDPERYEKGVAFLQQLGYTVVHGASVMAQRGFLAGPAELRADDINSFFADDAIDAILCARGGYGAAQLLDLLDFDMIRHHNKLFIGFSDITALHVALYEKAGLATVHGPMATSFAGKEAPFTRDAFARGLAQGCPDTVAMPEGTVLDVLYPGKAEGNLVGTNLSLLTSLTGTPYGLKGTGEILVIEEIGEEAYAIDRMLLQLEQSGLIRRVSGIVFGEFTNCPPAEECHDDFTVRQVCEYYAERWQVPTLWGLPAGHGPVNTWMPLGLKAAFDSDDDRCAIQYVKEE